MARQMDDAFHVGWFGLLLRRKISGALCELPPSGGHKSFVSES
jgi:hypothetical protein